MKALQITDAYQFEVIDLPMPEPKAGEVLLRLRYVGFCGSDLNTYRGRNGMALKPVIPGHEISATVERVAEGVPTSIQVGETVTVDPYTACGNCPSCRRRRFNACQHEIIGLFVRKVMFEELLPTLDLPEAELHAYANDVLERFCNPFVDHQLTSIMLNSFPKYQTRDLPALKRYVARRGELPRGLVLGLAAICIYYRGGQRADGTAAQPNDDSHILQLLADLWKTNDARCVAEGVLSAEELIWHEYGNLNLIPGLTNLLTTYIQVILDKGILSVVKEVINDK